MVGTLVLLAARRYTDRPIGEAVDKGVSARYVEPDQTGRPVD